MFSSHGGDDVIRPRPLFQSFSGPWVRASEVYMLRWAVIFFVVALVAGVLGFGGIAAGASEIAQILFYIFLVVFLVTLVMGAMRR